MNTLVRTLLLSCTLALGMISFADTYETSATCAYDQEKGAVVCCEKNPDGSKYCWYK